MEITKGQTIKTNIGTVEITDVIENHYPHLKGEAKTCVQSTLNGKGDRFGKPYEDNLPDFLKFISEVNIVEIAVYQSLVAKSNNL